MSLDHLIPAAETQLDSQFLAGTDVQYAWDSVSITNLLSCPRRYQLSIIEGYRSRATSSAIALTFGILFHKGLEFYHYAKALGTPHADAAEQALALTLALPDAATLPTDEDLDEAPVDEEDDAGIIQARNAKVRTRYHLARALVWYLEHYAEDPCQTIILPSGQPAVEYSFRIPLELPGTPHPIVLCGHIDRGVTFNDSIYASDYKTTKALGKSFFATFDLSHQMTGYSIAGQVIFEQQTSGVMIDGVALQVGGVQFGRAFTRRTPGQVREYFQLLGYVNEQALRHYETGLYPMNTAACFFCEFKEVCRQPPEYRDRYLNLHFEKKRGWNPLDNR